MADWADDPLAAKLEGRKPYTPPPRRPAGRFRAWMAARNRWTDPPIDGEGGEPVQETERAALPPELAPVVPDVGARLWIRMDAFLAGSRSEAGVVEFSALLRALDTFRELVDAWLEDRQVPITDDAELTEVALELLGAIAEGRYEGREEPRRPRKQDGGGDDPLRAQPRRQHQRR